MDNDELGLCQIDLNSRMLFFRLAIVKPPSKWFAAINYTMARPRVYLGIAHLSPKVGNKYLDLPGCPAHDGTPHVHNES